MIHFAPPRNTEHDRALPPRLVSIAVAVMSLFWTLETASVPLAPSDPVPQPDGPPAPSAIPEGSREPLAGLLPWDQELAKRWTWSGAWLYPVGDPNDMTAGEPEEPYRVLRGLGAGTTRSENHQGVDLSNRRPGGEVRAAANGVVVRARESKTNGYGHHVVLAHRLGGGGFAYSVYAHLAPGSIGVREGDAVVAGSPLGRVGRSGRASTDHLHFEVRVGDDPHQRWERVPPVDPLGFVRERLALQPPSLPDSLPSAR